MTAAMPAPDTRMGNTEWFDNWTLGHGLRFELMEASSQRVFLCQDKVTVDELRSFRPPEGFTEALVGEARADVAFFSRSPGAEVDGPLETAEIGGRRFAYVARPVGFNKLGSGAVEMTIDKHHTMLYQAGAVIDVLDLGDGTVATPAWGSRDPDVELTDRMLEWEWRLQHIKLSRDLIAVIPNPARVFVLDGGFGFHGPLDAAVLNDAGRVTPNDEVLAT